MGKKYANLIATDIPRMIQLPDHSRPSTFWVTPEIFPDIKIRIAGTDMSKRVNEKIADLHSHECPEVYLAISENRGDMIFEITLEDETYTVESPMTVYIPAGMKHKFKVVRADKERSYFFGILLDQ
jgi:mannose-6-phosphate isomerase-like protein (cupin superfamily)